MTIVDKWTKEELESMAAECTSMSEFAAKIGYKSKACFDIIRRKCKEFDISLEHFTGITKGAIKRTPENVFIKDSTATQTTLRKMYLKGEYTPYKCSICGQEPIWNGKSLTLTLDHINGQNHDDRLENLRWVCPNCDRQLDTFCAKNANRETFYNYKEKKQTLCIDCGKPISEGCTRCVACNAKSKRTVERPEADELRNILLEAKGNFSAVARRFNVNDNTIRKWCKGYNLPSHSGDYK